MTWWGWGVGSSRGFRVPGFYLAAKKVRVKVPMRGALAVPGSAVISFSLGRMWELTELALGSIAARISERSLTPNAVAPTPPDGGKDKAEA